MDIKYIKGVGEARARLFGKLGIYTMPDLVTYFPRAYEDRTQFKMISELNVGETVCIKAMAAAAPKLSHIRKGLNLVKLRVVDEFGAVEITFFNQTFIKDKIRQGETYIFYGKVEGSPMRLTMTNPLFEEETSAGSITGRIMPIYSLTAGLSQKIVASAIRSALDKCADSLPDVLPEGIVKEFELCRARFAYENIHFPEDAKSLELARKRLIFEELFVLVAAMRFMRLKRIQETGKVLEVVNFDRLYELLTFQPTDAQKRAISEAAKDLSSERPMSRLIQGDVGSGKTLVAMACCWMAWRSRCQAAFMAPTEILAKQHYRTMSKLLQPLGMSVELLTGSITAKQKTKIYEKLKNGEIDLVVGTHALISENVEFLNLALVITDEQHRFGVNQRMMLREKGDSPHVLVMSATPIPRTLALIIYGDLDVSIIDEMPPGRQQIETYVVNEQMRKRINAFVEKLVGEGRQIYIICPMVEENIDLDEGLKSVKDYYETLKNEVFPHLRVELVHGKMPTKKKDAAMDRFASGQADILVATTVVEVGVDVSNAALMIIENADRFGLSQLHQLRGRVGRGEHKSYCILFDSSSKAVSKERLEVMRETNDGFKIAEEDLKIRGPGDFFGSRQHGLPQLRIANFVSDMQVLHQAQNAVGKLMDSDPELKSPDNRKLSKEITRMFRVEFA